MVTATIFQSNCRRWPRRDFMCAVINKEGKGDCRLVQTSRLLYANRETVQSPNWQEEKRRRAKKTSERRGSEPKRRTSHLPRSSRREWQRKESRSGENVLPRG